MQSKKTSTSAEPKSKKKNFVFDEQSGVWFEIKPENRTDYIFANISIVYLMLMTIGIFWLLFDTWIGQHSIFNLLGYTAIDRLEQSVTFHRLAYTILGGALGGVVNGIRSFLVWHSERMSFGQRFIWKYLSLPWLGASLALFVYSLFLGGVVAFSGGINESDVSVTQSLLAFAIGGLAGYGSNDVSKWLDAQVGRVFKLPPAPVKVPEVIVPDLVGKTRAEAEAALRTSNLRLGAVTEQLKDNVPAGTIIDQNPQGDSMLEPEGNVDVTISILGIRAPAPVDLPKDAAAEALKKVDLAPGTRVER